MWASGWSAWSTKTAQGSESSMKVGEGGGDRVGTGGSASCLSGPEAPSSREQWLPCVWGDPGSEGLGSLIRSARVRVGGASSILNCSSGGM